MYQIQTQVLTLLLITILACVYVVIINIQLKKHKPTDEPRGILLLTEIFVSGMDKFVNDNLGKKWTKSFGPYIGSLGYIIFIGTLIGMLGFTAATSSLSVTFALALVTFILIQGVAIKTSGWGFFKRFAEPFIVFIPVNLIAIWAPLISMSMRLFANILAGSIIISMLYNFTGWLSASAFIPFNIFGVLIGPFFHAYFDVFAGLIQSIVFVSLTVILIAQEKTTE